MNHTYKAYIKPNDKYCIQHYGIKGQKWGVRNYEGYDGLLTPEGKERYYGGGSGRISKESKPVDSKTGLRIETEKLSELENVKRVNPEGVNDESLQGTTAATIAMELRKRGLDAQINFEELNKGLNKDVFKDTETALVFDLSDTYQMYGAMHYDDNYEMFDHTFEGDVQKMYKSTYNKVAAKRLMKGYNELQRKCAENNDENTVEKIKDYVYSGTNEKISAMESSAEIKAFKDMVDTKEGSRGSVIFKSNDSNKKQSMFYEVGKNGNVRITDAIKGKIYSYDQFYKAYSGKIKDIQAIRLDNAPLNNYQLKTGLNKVFD